MSVVRTVGVRALAAAGADPAGGRRSVESAEGVPARASHAGSHASHGGFAEIPTMPHRRQTVGRLCLRVTLYTFASCVNIMHLQVFFFFFLFLYIPLISDLQTWGTCCSSELTEAFQKRVNTSAELPQFLWENCQMRQRWKKVQDLQSEKGKWLGKKKKR